MSSASTFICSKAAGPLRGTLRVPGDKSVSHRAIMLAALADGVSRIDGFLEGEDTRATARAFASMGVRIEQPEDGVRVVHGVGMRGLRAPTQPIDCGNAGTGMRLLCGLLAAQDFDSVLVGDESLSKRPMLRVVEPLRKMGGRIETGSNGWPPLVIHGAASMQGIEYALPVASAQVKSALLLAGMYADGETVVLEPHPTRDYTESMLSAFGIRIDDKPGMARLTGGQTLRAAHIKVPADFSSAAFFIAAASLVPGSDVLLQEVGINPRRTGLLQALRLMGADIDLVNERNSGGERIADIRVRAARLHGAEIPDHLVPDMIDEFPALFAAAAAADGVTRVTGAAELRVKESDRLAAMANGLRAAGIHVEETADGASIRGGVLGSANIESHGDHRISMAFAVAAQVGSGELRIQDCANVATSFPGFDRLAVSCGMDHRVPN